jgi:tetratricopeptide (TPR) repeat protein
MTRHQRTAVLLSLVAAVSAVTWWAAARDLAARERGTGEVATSKPATLATSVPPAPTEAERRDRDIAFYERRAAEDAKSASDRSRLAALYLQRARAIGDFADYARAERFARRSLDLRTEHNGQTFGLLAAALLARHAFVDALAVARRADSLYPGVPAHLALLGEVELEIGNYAAATTHFTSIRLGREDFAVAARLARWRELTGRVDVARLLLRSAATTVDGRDDLPREQVAWFHYRLGELELRTGHLDAAASEFGRGLATFPGDYRILGGLARLAAARRRWTEAIDYGNQAIAIQLDPGTLGTISDAYAALGDTAQAAQFARAMTASALTQPGPIHRTWGLFLLDHGTPRDVKRVLDKCRAELRTRHDVYGYDLLAWALHKQGRDVAARAAMRHALAQHTEDAQLLYHAGMIEHALGDNAAARGYLEEALRVNPYFSATQAAHARTTLGALRAPHRV